ncbi:MAG: hypothetical protein KIT27_06380 [Legionellales bacterium]|nr:hypothetical protein [Legionellales bacterium]
MLRTIQVSFLGICLMFFTGTLFAQTANIATIPIISSSPDIQGMIHSADGGVYVISSQTGSSIIGGIPDSTGHINILAFSANSSNPCQWNLSAPARVAVTVTAEHINITPTTVDGTFVDYPGPGVKCPYAGFRAEVTGGNDNYKVNITPIKK